MEKKWTHFCFDFDLVRKNKEWILWLYLKNLLSRDKEFSFAKEYIFFIEIRIVVNTI